MLVPLNRQEAPLSDRADNLRTAKCNGYSAGGSGVVQLAAFSHKVAFIESQAELPRENIRTHHHTHYVLSFVALRCLDFDLESAKPAVAKRDAS